MIFSRGSSRKLCKADFIQIMQTEKKLDKEHDQYLFPVLQLRWSSTSVQHHLLKGRPDWAHSARPVLKAALSEFEGQETIYLRGCKRGKKNSLNMK